MDATGLHGRLSFRSTRSVTETLQAIERVLNIRFDSDRVEDGVIWFRASCFGLSIHLGLSESTPEASFSVVSRNAVRSASRGEAEIGFHLRALLSDIDGVELGEG